MKIEIIIRDTNSHGKRLGKRNCYLESCRVYKQAGDGLRLDNVAPLAYRWFHGAAMVFLNDNPSRADAHGTLPTEERIAQYEKKEVTA